MDENSWLISVGHYLKGVLSFVVILLFVCELLKKPRGIPPGSPFTLPFLGDLHLLILYKGNILMVFERLREKHVNIFSVYMGRELMIILNGYGAIQ